MTGQAAVIVAATGGDQAEVAGEAEQAGLLGLRLIGVEDLDPGQAGRGQAGDLLVGDEQIAIGPRVGDRGASRRASTASPRIMTILSRDKKFCTRAPGFTPRWLNTSRTSMVAQASTSEACGVRH